MQRMLLVSISLALVIAVGPASADSRIWDVCFTPGGKCADLIVEQLTGAKSSIYVQAYSFTSAPIAKALVTANKRGVNVRVILDKSQRREKYSAADFLANAGIDTRIDSCCAIAHNKIMVIDERVVVTGSFNFTKSAQERNAENVLILRDRELAQKYIANWNQHLATSEKYVGRSR